MNGDQAERRKEYLEERKLLVEAEREQSRSFDKAMLTLSVGALALSLIYMRDFAKTPSWSALLYGAWITFGISLLATSWSFLISQSALRKQRKMLDERHRGRPEVGIQTKNRFASATNWLNWWSVIAFTAGVVLLALFAIVNFPNKDSDMPNETQRETKDTPDKEQRGFVPQRPPADPPDQSEPAPPPESEPQSPPDSENEE